MTPFGAGTVLPEAWFTGGLIDPVAGIIAGVWEEPREAGHADLFQCAATAADTAAFGGPDNFRFTGGASLDRAQAYAKAVGEGVERYCAAIYDPTEMPLVDAASAPFATIDADLLELYPPELARDPDFLFVPFDARTPARWVEARRLGGGAVHVPAALVHVPWYYDVEAGEPAFCQPISTGLACHQTLEQSILGGLMEVVERDAFTLTWQSRSPLLAIERRGLPAESAEIIRRIEATGARVRLGFAPMDHGIPTCVVVQEIDSGRMPALSLAAASALDPAVALRKALEELVHTFRWMVRLMRAHPPLDPGEGYAGVVDQESHLRFWCPIEQRPEAAFLWDGPYGAELAEIPKLATGEAGRDLAVLAERLAAVGAEPLHVELTTEDVAAFGLRVVRALIPGFNPLFMGHALRSRENPRLRARLGRRAEETGWPAERLNDLPHPFP